VNRPRPARSAWVAYRYNDKSTGLRVVLHASAPDVTAARALLDPRAQESFDRLLEDGWEGSLADLVAALPEL
jgi:hypothetical protein